MSEEKTQDVPLAMFAIPMAELDKIQASDGSRRERLPFGDYRFRVKGITEKMKSGDKNPYKMMLVEVEIVAAHDEKNKDQVGRTTNSLYGADLRAHPFMLQRAKQFVVATGVPIGPTGVKGSEFMGREFDATIVWELSKPDTDAKTGKTKRYVNDRIKGERPVGVARSPKLNPESESKQAIAYLAQFEGDVAPTDEATALPWDSGSVAGETVVTPDEGEPTEAAGDASAADDPNINNYRALAQLGGADAPDARAALVAAGINADGEVNAALLNGPIGTRWKAHLAKTAKNGKSPLAGLPPLGGPKGSTARP